MIAKIVMNNSPREAGSIELRHLSDVAIEELGQGTPFSSTTTAGRTILTLKGGGTIDLGEAPITPESVVEILSSEFNGLVWNGAENFPSLTYVGGVGPQGCSALKSIQTGTQVELPQMITVDPHGVYELSAWVRCEADIPTAQTFGIGVQCYDIYGGEITGEHTSMGTPTTLAFPLSIGDTVAQVTSAAVFDSGEPDICFLDYVNGSGFNFGVTPFTRWRASNVWAGSSVVADVTGAGSIQLDAPWTFANPLRTDGVWVGGHPIARGRAYQSPYIVPASVDMSTEWQSVKGLVSGVNLSYGGTPPDKFHAGTVSVRLNLLLGGDFFNTPVYVATPTMRRIG